MFAPSGTQVATAGDDYYLRLWDASHGHDSKAFKPFLCPISALCWNPQGNMIAVAGTDNQMGIVNTRPNLSLGRKFSGHSDCITALHFSHATRHLVSGSADRTVRVWDISSGKEVKQNPVMSAVTCMDVNHQDTVFASGHKSGDLRFYSMSTFEKTHHIQNLHSCQITSVNFTIDHSQVVTTATDGTIKVVDMRT